MTKIKVTPIMTITLLLLTTSRSLSFHHTSKHDISRFSSQSLLSSSLLQRTPFTRQQPQPLFVATDPTTDTSSATNDNSSTWWQSYKLKDADLPLSIRSDFPILSTTLPSDSDEPDKPLIYLDSAATSQKPTAVLDALMTYYTTANSNVHRGAHRLSQKATSLYEEARDTVAAFVGAQSRNEVVFTAGATESLNLLASCLMHGGCITEGDEIVVTVAEHHSNIVPWHMIAERVPGVTVKFVPLTEDHTRVDMNQLEEMLNERVKVVSFGHVSNVLSTTADVPSIVHRIRTHAPHAKIILDACQSVPHTPINLPSLGVDFAVASGHKLCGPTGIGFLWGKEEELAALPPFQGGGEMIDRVTTEGSTYAPGPPARFEAGTPPIAQAVGMAAAMRYLSHIGMERIYAYEKELGAYLFRRLSGVEGVTVLGPQEGSERGALASFVCEGVHPSDLSTFLDMEGVAVRAGHHCCQPLHTALGYSHSIRASLYFYNTKEDVDVFIEKLEETLSFFRNME